jgi:hypothetical protein
MLTAREKADHERRKRRMNDALLEKRGNCSIFGGKHTVIRVDRHGRERRTTFNGDDAEIMRQMRVESEYRELLRSVRVITTPLTGKELVGFPLDMSGK